MPMDGAQEAALDKELDAADIAEKWGIKYSDNIRPIPRNEYKVIIAGGRHFCYPIAYDTTCGHFIQILGAKIVVICDMTK